MAKAFRGVSTRQNMSGSDYPVLKYFRGDRCHVMTSKGGLIEVL
jgi:hypothetical protein